VVPAAPIMDAAADQAAPPPSAAARAAYGALAERAGLNLDARQFAQLCEALPHVEAMAAALPADLPFWAELANSVSFVGE
jgi:aspartyl-tRNA(Asn)/glutamyl-tRNA(Gln) amidotransferase subunit A